MKSKIMKKTAIIKKYKKDRNIKDHYKLDEDELYLIEEIQKALNQAQSLPIDNQQEHERLNKLEEFASMFSYQLANGIIDVLKAKEGHEKEVADMVRLNVDLIQQLSDHKCKFYVNTKTTNIYEY